MLLQKGVKSLFGVCAAVLLLNGCAGSVFPDFEDDDTEIVINDGGKVEVKKIKEKGILIADKENAAYEGEDAATAEEITPAKVVEVKADELEPADDNVKVVEYSMAVEDEKTTEEEVETYAPSMHYLAATVYFENGGAVVANGYRQKLKEIARVVKENNATVTVYGFASSRTRDTDPASHKLANFKVSAERAANTAKALRRAGVPADKINVQALSDSMPLYQEVMPEGERLNRRAEIYLTY